MKLDVRYANHPEDSKHYTTEELRKHYFIETIDMQITQKIQNTTQLKN